MLTKETAGLDHLGRRKGFRGRRRRRGPIYVAPVVYEPAPIAVMPYPVGGCRQTKIIPGSKVQAYMAQRGYTLQVLPTPTGPTYFFCPTGTAETPQPLPVAIPAPPMPAPIPQAEPAEAPEEEEGAAGMGSIF